MKFFSDFCMKCLNSQVRINKMVNEHTVEYHPSPSKLTSRTHSLILLWTPNGFIFSPECFLNFFKPVFRTMEAEKFQILGVKITGKCMCESKCWICPFLLMSLSKNLPQVLIIASFLPGQEEVNHFPQTTFFVFFLSRKEGRLWSWKNDKN